MSTSHFPRSQTLYLWSILWSNPSYGSKGTRGIWSIYFMERLSLTIRKDSFLIWLLTVTYVCSICSQRAAKNNFAVRGPSIDDNTQRDSQLGVILSPPSTGGGGHRAMPGDGLVCFSWVGRCYWCLVDKSQGCWSTPYNAHNHPSQYRITRVKPVQS